MNKRTLTSVVIPAYNAELYIERTLRSALCQTYRDIEVIVVDDGSTDNTRAIAETFAGTDDRVRIISVPNGGVAKARNLGIAEAKGEYVAFLDADDLWHPTKIERQVAAMSGKCGDSQPAAVYAFSRTIDKNDRVTGGGQQVLLNGYSFARHLCTRPVGNGSSLLVRREVALAVGGFDPAWAARGMGGCEDLDFELKVALKYPIAAVGQYLVGYREYLGNMSSHGKPIALGAVGTITHHIKQCPELPRWVARNALGSMSEYAFRKLIGTGHHTLLLREFARLLRTTFGKGLRFAWMIFIGKLSHLLSRATPTQKVVAFREDPQFYNLSPDFILNSPSGSKERARTDKLLRRLERVDAVLAKSAARSLDYRKEIAGTSSTMIKPDPRPS
jgi:glycosyltransferase involved in cell wall biosynthesis